MSISIRDCLKLPCMREARVLAGGAGLDSIVSAVSVLEYTEPTPLQDELLRCTVYTGSELIITALASVRDSVEDQCNVIRRMSATGGVGILLYYVGMFLKQVDKRLLETADELGFVLICMPENRYELRYSEAITEIQNAIFQDQNQSTNFVPEVLDKLSSLAPQQRSMDSLLRIISDRLQLTVIIIDRAWRLLNYASWPAMLERDILTFLDAVLNAKEKSETIMGKGGELQYFRRGRIKDHSALHQNLIVMGTEEPIPTETLRQIEEAVSLFLKMWDERKDNLGVLDFIRSVIRDEPVKMRQLARNLNVDETRIQNMILFKPLTMEMTDYRKIMQILKENLSRYCKTMVMDIYDDFVVVFLDDGVSSQWVPTLLDIKDQIRQKNIACHVMYSCDLKSTTEVRDAYISMTDMLDVAVRLYPRAEILSAYEIRFAGQCREIIDQGEAAVMKQMRILRVLKCDDPHLERDLGETLAKFYFDAYMNTGETARQMFLHPNTIKYRLKKISEKLGCKVTDMPEMMDLYRAVALKRLLEE
ncbi:MAG: PucR family transcriptional regulator [Lachnospiraceae bacterium]|nr:PucR family transcriptional regulator [Lachnospiraceae bacterium]